MQIHAKSEIWKKILRRYYTVYKKSSTKLQT
jgi:hypothetical protein